MEIAGPEPIGGACLLEHGQLLLDFARGGVAYDCMVNGFNVSFEDISSMDNLCAAWEEFLVGKRNRTDVTVFARNLGDEIASLHDDLLSGHYRHGSYVRFSVNDPKPRIIHKASVRDRLVHHAVHRQLYPHFARTFIADSFSCQVGKGTHRAIDRFRDLARQAGRNKPGHVGCLRETSASFSPVSIMAYCLVSCARRIVDDWLFGLMEDRHSESRIDPRPGVAPWQPDLPIFANVCLNEFDWFVKTRIGAKFYVRYADDFVILSDSRDWLIDILLEIKGFLFSRLTFDLHPDKVLLKTLASGVDFLGWVHFPHHRTPRTTTRHRALRRVSEGYSDASVQSYLGLFKHGDANDLRNEIRNIHWLSGDG